MSFNDIFTQLCYTRDANNVFTDFLDYSIDQFIINPDVSYFNHEKYNEKEYKLFYNLLYEYTLIMQEKLQAHNWYDFLGVFYEDVIISKYKAGTKGQFFTPVNVVDLMTNINKEGDGSCYDCAAGSGRMLLSYHTLHPLDYCFAWDIDEQAAKMCVLNFLVHGVKGSVCWMNSLNYDFFDGWKIHEFPFTIMKINNVSESESFIR